ncbi:MAG: chemotaxis protein CheW [Moraxellaceae bacterium]|nr:MAG: chemotaxis protein CheW [Moraxellaceae bacterium]
MASILDSVDQRTKLVGENRLEILMFSLERGPVFAINVFKIQEVQMMPKLTILPDSHPSVVGVTHTRGKTIPVIDLGLAIGMPALSDRTNCNIIIAEYNNTIQAFMVKNVDRIVNMNWSDIMPPPPTAGRNHYLTAITKVDDKIVEVIDVEKILQEIAPCDSTISDGVLGEDIQVLAKGLEVFAVDDSTVGLAQVEETVRQVGLSITTARDGAQALAKLKRWADEGIDMPKKFVLVITDAEMPEMDGYRLTTEIRNDPRLKDLHVILHTSLSGSFNEAMVEKVGCDNFLSKFEPDKLAGALQDQVRVYRQKYPL